MPKRTTPTPEPVPSSLVCSICDLAWSLHPDKPTVLDCVALLKSHRYVNWWTRTWQSWEVTYITSPTITTTGTYTIKYLPNS